MSTLLYEYVELAPHHIGQCKSARLAGGGGSVKPIDMVFVAKTNKHLPERIKIAMGTIPMGFANIYPSATWKTYTHTRLWVRDHTHAHTHMGK
jgi:hypothetical protein